MRGRQARVLFIVSCLVIIGHPRPAAADVITVRNDGTGDHSTIQAAVDAAVDKDVVLIGPGTYLESIEIEGKTLTLRSEQPLPRNPTPADWPVTIDGEDARRPLFLSGGGLVSLEGIRVTRGSAPSGGGLYLNFGTMAVLTDCLMDANEATADHGGGIYLGNNTDLTLTNCRIEGNRASRYGGGVYADYGGDVDATDSTWSDNVAGVEGGGVWIYGGQAGDHPTFDGCTFTGNAIDAPAGPSYGGGLRIRYGPVTLDQCVFESNSNVGTTPATHFGGAVHFGSVSTTTLVRNCVFRNNEAGRAGGLYLTAGTIEDSSFESNRASWIGGAVEATNTSFLRVTFQSNACSPSDDGEGLGGGASHVSGNTRFEACIFDDDQTILKSSVDIAASGGGAIRAENAALTIAGCTFTDARTEVVENVSASDCGGGAIMSTGGSLTIEGDSSFTGCAAIHHGEQPVRFGGGAILAIGAEISITNADFLQNSLLSDGSIPDGSGGGAARLVDAPSTITISGTRFEANRIESSGTSTSAGGGGAVLADGDVDLVSCEFLDNDAMERAAIASRNLRGGACMLRNGMILLDQCTFLRNQASHRGGAVLLDGVLDASIVGCTIRRHGSDIGGAIDWTVTPPGLANTTMCDNGPENLADVDWVDEGGNSLSAHCDGTSSLVRVPEDHPTILEAIRHTIDGDTLEIGPGIWTESLHDFGRDLDWIGREGADATIIDLGDATARCLDASSATAGRRIEGITFRNAVTDATLGPGAGLRVSHGIQVVDCVFENLGATGTVGEWTRGGGIAALSNLSVSGCTFENCRTSDNEGGGGIGLVGGTLSVESSAFDSCEATTSNNGRRGGGGIMADGTQAVITGCSFEACTAAGGYGGAMLADVDTLVVTTSTFDFNEATLDGGGVAAGGYEQDSPTLVIEDCDFRDGRADRDGGAVATLVKTTITETRLDRNAAFRDGGGILSTNDLLVSSSLLQENDAERDGGGISATNALEVTGSQIIQNIAGEEGGGIHLTGGVLLLDQSRLDSNESTRGGGVAIGSAQAMFHTLEFANNSAEEAGSLLVETSTLLINSSTISDSTSLQDGGGMRIEGSAVDLSDLELSGNTAGGRGGGGLLIDSSLVARSCTIRLNEAGGDGGGLLLDGVDTPIFEDSSFTSNVAGANGGGIRLTGVLGENGCRLLRCELLDNHAAEAGGGLRTDEVDTKVTIVDGIVGENVAEVGGGINSFDTRQLTLQNVAVYNNHATLFGGGLYDEGYGGGLQETVINESTVSGNTAGAVGGGIYLLLREMAISNTAFCGNDPGQIIGFWTDYGGNSFGDGTCFFDCNGNGIEDGVEIAEGQLQDCDENGVPDLCEIADGSAEDCDGDGVPDVCAKGGFVTATSGTLGPFGLGVPRSLSLVGTPPAGGPVTITVEAIGDLSGPSEYGVVTVNGVEVGTLFEFGEDCGDDSLIGSLEVDAAIFNMLTAAGPAEIVVTGSIAVDAEFCDNGSTRLTIDYLRASDGDCNDNGLLDHCEIAGGLVDDCNGNGVPDDCELDGGMAADCNGNGLIDGCEIASGDVGDQDENGIPDACECPFDLTGDGMVDGSDIGAFLGFWGTSDPMADFDGDGAVRASDLGLLLGAFGSCG